MNENEVTKIVTKKAVNKLIVPLIVGGIVVVVIAAVVIFNVFGSKSNNYNNNNPFNDIINQNNNDNNGNSDKNNEKFEYDQNFINNTDKINYLVFVFSREITRLSNSSDWTNAVKIAQQAVKETEKDPRIVKMEENLKYNISVTYHNKFATFYNKGDKNSAAAALEEGLAIVPDSKILLENLERLKRE